MPVKTEIALDLVRRAAVRPHTEPVRIGIPFARGIVASTDAIEISDLHGRILPAQVTPLARWPDGSTRWALLDVLLTCTERDREAVLIRVHDGAAKRPSGGEGPMLHADNGDYRVDTGAALVTLRRDVFAPFAALRLHQAPNAAVAHAEVALEDADGRVLLPHLRRLEAETHGAVRLTLRGDGEFRGGQRGPLCRFVARLSFYRGLSLIRLDFTIHNPQRARHPGGVWDLGDPGSILFRALSVDIALTPTLPHRLAWRVSPEHPEQNGERVEIYQASSGGENWASPNHVDRTGNVRLPFRGCRVTHGDCVDQIDRVAPVLSHSVSPTRLSVALTKFWQQFPSALEGGPNGLRVGLFPRQAPEPFELQGGEQKTQTIFFAFGPADDASASDLSWVHDPLVPCIPPEYFSASGAFPHFVPARDDPHSDYVHLIQRAIEGPQSFFRKREVIDEYGWRHFGDTYADHEDVYFTGKHPVISHYNNQYDLLHGFLLHFARTADPRWFELAVDLARHVVDIDIYHTLEDKPAYNGGLFWHTDHYQDAGRSTHRSYSGDSPRARQGRAYGGGPSNEHNYTTGLLHFYYLTGDPAAREAVRELADWVVRMDDGTGSLLGHFDSGPTGLASCTRGFSYHGPGRGAGNSINAMIDAYHLTGDRRFLLKAEELIARCIHPKDDPELLNLRDAETRWSYLVFLQVLGKYLDLKCELDERDFTFKFARASLLRYAGWMLENEEPFLARAERLEYPTESWPAQDIRKCCVFDYAAKYGPPEMRRVFTERAEAFFAESIRGVLAFETRACARPLAVLLASGAQRAGFRLQPPVAAPVGDGDPDFGSPSGFLSQRDRVKRQLRSGAGLRTLARALVRPSLLRRLASGRIW